MGNAKIWQKMTVKQIREGLQDTGTVLIPIGCTEQHGYHLTTDTDNHNAWQISTRAAEKTGSFVAPLLPYTFSGGELEGSININLNVVSQMITEILRALAFHGLQNLIIVLGHGGSENTEAVERGAYHFVRDYPGYQDRNVAVCNVLMSDIFRPFYDEERDYHAGAFETSLMMFWAPDEVLKGEITTDRPEILEMMRDDPDAYQVSHKNVDVEEVVPRVGQHPDIEVGVMGDPGKASAQMGEKLAAEAVNDLVSLIKTLEGANS
ncbi:MAG: creatininase family protein [Armatimonadota bacterium]